MSTHGTASQQLYRMIYSLFKRKYALLAVVVTTFAGILFGTYLVRPLWKARAKLWVQYSPKQQLTMLEGITTPATAVPGVNPAGDVIEMLTSRDLAEKVAIRHGRDKLWERRRTAPESTRDEILWYLRETFLVKPMVGLESLGLITRPPDNYLAEAVEELLRDLEDVAQEEDTTIIHSAIWAESPEIATAMSNSLVELLLEETKRASRASIEQSIRGTRGQLEEAERGLASAQAELKAFKEASDLVLFSDEAAILLNRLDRYDAELKQLQAEAITLHSEKGPEHSEIKAIEARIAEYRDDFIPAVEGRLRELPAKEVELSRLTNEVTVRQGLYSTLKEKLLELEVLRDSTVGDLEIRVVDPAKVYSHVRPDWPRWILNIPLGLLASVLAGVGFVFFLEYWNTSATSVKELEEITGEVVFGAIPRLGAARRRGLLRPLWRHQVEGAPAGHLVRFGENGRLPALAECDNLAESIQVYERDGRQKVYVISSPRAGEGKSTVTLLLASAMRNQGKRVLVVEASPPAPSLGRLLHVTPDETASLRPGPDPAGPGGEGEAGPQPPAADEDDAPDGGLAVVLAADGGDGPPGAGAGIRQPSGIRRLLRTVGDGYDYVLIDSPCLKRFPRALTMSRVSDGVILVVEANRTPRREISMALERIRAVDGKVAGLVLNKRVNHVPEFIQSFLY